MRDVACSFLVATIVLAVATPSAGAMEERHAAPVLSWETGTGKGYVIPAFELGGFIFGLNQRSSGVRDRNQSVETITVSYNFLGHTPFGAVESRPESSR